MEMLLKIFRQGIAIEVIKHFLEISEQVLLGLQAWIP